MGETATVFLVFVPFNLELGTLFFTSPSSESDDSESELVLDSPSDLEDGGADFGAGVLTLDLALTFDLGGMELFGGEGTIFVLECFLPLSF